MIGAVRTWLNSMQAHMIGFAAAVIVLLTAMSVAIVVIAGPPQRSPMTVYDVSRVIRGLPPARETLADEFEVYDTHTASPPQTEVEQRLSKILADDLGRPVGDVNLHLGNRAINYFAYMERQADLYASDGRGSPIMFGTVVVTVRRPDGQWVIYSRRSKDGFENFWQLLRASPWLGFLVIVPFATWFSRKISRPVRAFAQAASRVSGGTQVPVPVVGPTETRVAAEALNEMQARIRAFVGERTALVGAIAHDLRTPLNSLRFRVARAPDELRIPAEGDIKQLDRLINSILDYVESDGRVLSVEALDLASLLQSMVDDLEDRGIKVDFASAPAHVEGDLLLLRRLFANLIDNAVKFGSHVSIALATTPAEVTVRIADDGPGMAPSDLARAFEPFFRGERSRSRATGGSGLGLSIAKSVVDAHGGHIHLANGAAGGLVAEVTLPLRQTPPEPA